MFKAGDEVTLIRKEDRHDPFMGLRYKSQFPTPEYGQVYLVEQVVSNASEVGLVIKGFPNEHPCNAWPAVCFRKVLRSRFAHTIAALQKLGEEEPISVAA
jgi:hypothetical protein